MFPPTGIEETLVELLDEVKKTNQLLSNCPSAVSSPRLRRQTASCNWSPIKPNGFSTGSMGRRSTCSS